MFVLLLFSFSAVLFSFILSAVFLPRQVLPRIKNPELKRKLELWGVPLISLLSWSIAWAAMMFFLGEDLNPRVINEGMAFTGIVTLTMLFAVISLVPYFFINALFFLAAHTVGRINSTKQKNKSVKDYSYAKSIIEYFAAAVSILFFCAGFAFVVALLSDEWANPQASRFFVLHAAIKNTCLIDPLKVHCPQKLSDIGIIEPQEFAIANTQTNMSYEYNSATNNYTFMVRYSPRALVVFDQRLVGTDGVDFKEYRVRKSAASDYDEVIDPPTFAGSWKSVPKWRPR